MKRKSSEHREQEKQPWLTKGWNFYDLSFFFIANWFLSGRHLLPFLDLRLCSVYKCFQIYNFTLCLGVIELILKHPNAKVHFVQLQHQLQERSKARLESSGFWCWSGIWIQENGAQCTDKTFPSRKKLQDFFNPTKLFEKKCSVLSYLTCKSSPKRPCPCMAPTTKYLWRLNLLYWYQIKFGIIHCL